MKRLQFEIPDDKLEQLEAMKGDMGLRTYKDLFDNAMTIANWVIRQRKKGSFPGAYNEKTDTFSELVMPCIEFIRPEKD